MLLCGDAVSTQYNTELFGMALKETVPEKQPICSTGTTRSSRISPKVFYPCRTYQISYTPNRPSLTQRRMFGLSEFTEVSANSVRCALMRKFVRPRSPVVVGWESVYAISGPIYHRDDQRQALDETE